MKLGLSLELIQYHYPLASLSWFFFNKGEILSALLNSSGTRWVLFCLISGSLCLFFCLLVCVACASIEATCLPSLTCEEIGVCVCVYTLGRVFMYARL